MAVTAAPRESIDERELELILNPPSREDANVFSKVGAQDIMFGDTVSCKDWRLLARYPFIVRCCHSSPSLLNCLLRAKIGGCAVREFIPSVAIQFAAICLLRSANSIDANRAPLLEKKWYSGVRALAPNVSYPFG